MNTLHTFSFKSAAGLGAASLTFSETRKSWVVGRKMQINIWSKDRGLKRLFLNTSSMIKKISWWFILHNLSYRQTTRAVPRHPQSYFQHTTSCVKCRKSRKRANHKGGSIMARWQYLHLQIANISKCFNMHAITSQSPHTHAKMISESETLQLLTKYWWGCTCGTGIHY